MPELYATGIYYTPMASQTPSGFPTKSPLE